MQAHIPYKSQEKVQHFCTYPPGIEYAGIDPIPIRKEEYIICAHIPRELNMQAL